MARLQRIPPLHNCYIYYSLFPPSKRQFTSIILRQTNFITVQTAVTVSQTLPIPSFIKMTSHLLKRL